VVRGGGGGGCPGEVRVVEKRCMCGWFVKNKGARGLGVESV
jgi:hypothetical protein